MLYVTHCYFIFIFQLESSFVYPANLFNAKIKIPPFTFLYMPFNTLIFLCHGIFC